MRCSAGVIVANSVIGVVQELRAKKVLDQLRVVNAPRAHVVRDGKVVELQTHELVLDDVVELRTGAQVVADGMVLTHENLEIDESLLTGEADPVVKDDGDEVLSGSAVVAGTGRMVVTKVGAENYAVEARRRGASLHAGQLAAAQRRQPHRQVGRVPHHPGRSVARQQPVPAPRRGLAAIDHQHRRRPGRHGAGGSRAADQRRVRRRRGAAGPQAMPRAGTAGHRGARSRRRVVRRQDRHHHRRNAWRSPRCRPSATPIAPSIDLALAALAQLDPDPNATSRALQNAYTEATDVDRHRPRAVLVGAQVERDELRRQRQLGARRTRERDDVGLRTATCATSVEDARPRGPTRAGAGQDRRHVQRRRRRNAARGHGRSRSCCSKTSSAATLPRR